MKKLRYLIVCFTQCFLLVVFFFDMFGFLLPAFCLSCVICWVYVCIVTHRYADFRIAWLVYALAYCVPIATLNKTSNLDFSRFLYLGDARIKRRNEKHD